MKVFHQLGWLRVLIGVLPVAMGPALAGEPRPSDPLAIRVWGPAEGLPEESIFGMAESEDGYVWIAVRDNLTRFDGQKFHHFFPARRLRLHDNGLGGVASSAGRLWVGARDYVASSSADIFQSFTNVDFRVARLPRAPGERFGVAAMQVRPNGDLLLRRANGIYLVRARIGANGDPQPELLIQAPAGETIRGFFEGPGGRIWYATTSGIWLREGTQQRRVAGPSIEGYALVESREGALWAFARDALYRIEGGKAGRIPVRGNMTLDPIRGLIESRDGAIWAGESGGIVHIQDGETRRIELTPHIRADEIVQALLQSKDGSIWAGTSLGRLIRIQRRIFHTVDTDDGLAHSALSAVAQDASGAMWVASRTAGAHTRGAGGWRLVPGSDGSLLSAIAPLPDGRMLLAAARGLLLGDASGVEVWKPVPAGLSPRHGTLSRIYGDHFYYSDSATVYRVQVPKGRELHFEPLGQAPVVRALIENGRDVWAISWDGGIFRFRDGKTINYPIEGGIERRGFTLFPLSPELLLVGTNTGVLAFDPRAGRLLETGPVFPDDQVFHVQPDDHGHLWFAGRNSLLRAPRQAIAEYFAGRRAAVHPLRLSTFQGLASANFGLGTSSVGTLDASGRIWLASLRGAIHFAPLEVSPARELIRCAVSAILADGNPVALNGIARIPPGTRRLQIRYAVLDGKASENPMFRYRLRGDGGSWTESTGAEAAFTYLRPGAYTFQLQSRVVAQDWAGPVTALRLEVLPFWYQRAEFQLAGVLLAVMLVLSGILWRERQARRTREDLEARVQQRTEDLVRARAAAEAARQEAEDAARAKADFLATMSHEIRTPLNGIVGMIQLMEATGGAEAQREIAPAVRSSAESLMRIVNDVLDFSKFEAGALVVERVPFPLARMAATLRTAFQPQAEAKGLDLAVVLEAGLPAWVQGDENRVRQILTNLLANSVKFTGRGSIALLIGREDEQVITFRVRDSGIGIPADKLQMIFEVFTQAEASTTRRFGGTGLGLAICRRLASAMGGTIAVESTEGEGSEFTVRLPLPACPEPQPAGFERGGEGLPEGLRVLVVEDNDVNQLVARRLLESLGCQAMIASDGGDALRRVQAEPFDIILMDCHMPVMDGFEATRLIRALPPPAGRIPIIALTASALEDVRAQCFAAGMDGYLAKPIQLRELQETLRLQVAVLSPERP